MFEIPEWNLGAPAKERKNQNATKKRKGNSKDEPPKNKKKKEKNQKKILTVERDDTYQERKSEKEDDEKDISNVDLCTKSQDPVTEQPRLVFSTKPSLGKIKPTILKKKSQLDRMQKNLAGGRFRYINEQLYTCDSKSAFSLLQSEPELFNIYHEGFRNQVTKWPTNPLELIIDHLGQSKKKVIADMGCGDAALGLKLKERHLIHSYDLVSVNERVTACDFAHTPLKDNSVDVVVFCLSLMGTNYSDFIKEAIRILRKGGSLIVAEVASRMENPKEFIKWLSCLGFKKVDGQENKMFLLYFFEMSSKRAFVEPTNFLLKPCIYKRR